MTRRSAREWLGVRVALVAVVAAGSLACRSRPAGMREWRPSDHSHEDGESPPETVATPEEDDPMIAAQAIWLAQCATCHGQTGHGDGPQSSLTHPRDLTDATFQVQRTDAQLRDAIVHGRNLMPAFGPIIRPEGIDALVRFVRQMRP